MSKKHRGGPGPVPPGNRPQSGPPSPTGDDEKQPPDAAQDADGVGFQEQDPKRRWGTTVARGNTPSSNPAASTTAAPAAADRHPAINRAVRPRFSRGRTARAIECTRCGCRPGRGRKSGRSVGSGRSPGSRCRCARKCSRAALASGTARAKWRGLRVSGCGFCRRWSVWPPPRSNQSTTKSKVFGLGISLKPSTSR